MARGEPLIRQWNLLKALPAYRFGIGTDELAAQPYVMRQQVFHGAATSGSKLNRTALKRCTAVLTQVVPAMIEIMMAATPETDWGEVCFPPVSR